MGKYTEVIPRALKSVFIFTIIILFFLNVSAIKFDTGVVLNTSVSNSSMTFNSVSIYSDQAELFSEGVLLYNVSWTNGGLTVNSSTLINWSSENRNIDSSVFPYYISSSNSQKEIGSSLNHSINASISISVIECISISGVEYVSASGNYSSNYTSANFTHSNNQLSFDVNEIEPTSVGNVITIDYTELDCEVSVGGAGGGSFPLFRPSDSQMVEGYIINLNKEWSLIFNFNNETHKITLKELLNDSARLTIESEVRELVVGANETRKIDIDEDGYYDLEISCLDLHKGKFLFKLIFPEIVEEPFVESKEEIEKPIYPEKDIFPWLILLGLFILIVIIWRIRKSYWFGRLKFRVKGILNSIMNKIIDFCRRVCSIRIFCSAHPPKKRRRVRIIHVCI